MLTISLLQHLSQLSINHLYVLRHLKIGYNSSLVFDSCTPTSRSLTSHGLSHNVIITLRKGQEVVRGDNVSRGAFCNPRRVSWKPDDFEDVIKVCIALQNDGQSHSTIQSLILIISIRARQQELPLYAVKHLLYWISSVSWQLGIEDGVQSLPRQN